jgi:hypothetical protein
MGGLVLFEFFSWTHPGHFPFIWALVAPAAYIRNFSALPEPVRLGISAYSEWKGALFYFILIVIPWLVQRRESTEGERVGVRSLKKEGHGCSPR